MSINIDIVIAIELSMRSSEIKAFIQTLKLRTIKDSHLVSKQDSMIILFHHDYKAEFKIKVVLTDIKDINISLK